MWLDFCESEFDQVVQALSAQTVDGEEEINVESRKAELCESALDVLHFLALRSDYRPHLASRVRPALLALTKNGSCQHSAATSSVTLQSGANVHERALLVLGQLCFASHASYAARG